MQVQQTTPTQPSHGMGCLCCTPFLRDFTRRVTADLSRRTMMMALGASASTVGLGAYSDASAQTEAPAEAPRPTVFANVRLFDGRSDALRDGFAVVVEGDKVTAVQDAAAPLPEGAEVIDGRGGVLMPGLIDAHWHTIMAAVPQAVALAADPAYLHIVAAEEAGRTLMRGFTSVRDAGGPAFGLKRAIDEGQIIGPRIFPSGAMISQTSGHADFRSVNELPRFPSTPGSHLEKVGAGMIADGRDEVLRRVREQLMQGATQIKLMGGGGVASYYDPLEVTQHTEDEQRAAIEAASDYGTYVMVHAYTPQAIRRAIAAGVRCIEHGQLVDDATAALMAETGTMWSLQPFFDDEDAIPFTDPVSRAKQVAVSEGTAQAYELAKKHGIAVAFGTDVLFDASLALRQGKLLAKLGRFHTAFDVLMMATSGTARYLEACGTRNPYPAPLGVIEPGSWADMIPADGDPTADLDLVADPDRNFRVIMKNGAMVKQAA